MAKQKYFGKWCNWSAGSEAYELELLARNHGLSVVPVSEEVEVTEESNFNGQDFTRFSMNDDGYDYTEIISTLRYEDGEWIFTAQDIDMPLSDEDMQYLKKHYTNETSEIFKNGGKPKDQKQQQASKPTVVNDHKGAADPLRDIPAAALRPVPNTPINPVTAATPIVPTVATLDPKAKGIQARMNPDGSVNLSVSTQQPTGAPVVTPKAPKATSVVPGNIKARLDAASRNAANALIYQTFPWVKDLETKLSGNGSFVVETNAIAGIVRMDVSTPEGKKMDKYSMTIDPAGTIVTNHPKWWPGTKNDQPIDFKVGYKYSDKAIEAYIAGEEIPQSELSYNEEVAKLNKIVDLRSIFNVAKTEEEAHDILVNISNALKNKRISDVIAKDYSDYRFTIGQYADKDNFELFTPQGVYSNIGGQLATNAVEVKVCIAKNKAPKIITK